MSEPTPTSPRSDAPGERAARTLIAPALVLMIVGIGLLVLEPMRVVAVAMIIVGLLLLRLGLRRAAIASRRVGLDGAENRGGEE